MISERERIRTLNDELRQHHRGGLIVLTRGLEALGPELVQTVVDAVSRFDAFTTDNDPSGEHDLGSVEVQGHRVFFKIDTYDQSLSCYSPDPADPTVTRRVMTLMLAKKTDNVRPASLAHAASQAGGVPDSPVSNKLRCAS